MFDYMNGFNMVASLVCILPHVAAGSVMSQPKRGYSFTKRLRWDVLRY